MPAPNPLGLVRALPCVAQLLSISPITLGIRQKNEPPARLGHYRRCGRRSQSFSRLLFPSTVILWLHESSRYRRDKDSRPKLHSYLKPTLSWLLLFLKSTGRNLV